MDPLPLVNVDQLAIIAGDNPEPMIPIYRDFAGEVEKSLAHVRQALATGDREPARLELHKIKGSAGTLALPTLHHVVAQLEAQVTAGLDPSTAQLEGATQLAGESITEVLRLLGG